MGYSAVPTLMIATLVAALLIGGFVWARHMRKPENRHPMDGVRERNIDEIKRDAPAERPDRPL